MFGLQVMNIYSDQYKYRVYNGFVQYNRSVVCICYLVGVYACIVCVTWLMVCVYVYISV